MTLPELRREDGMIVGYRRSRIARRLRHHLAARLTHLLRPHDWSPWHTDDYEGPGELMEPDDPDSFMPYLSRDSRPGEYGHRSCRRRFCGAFEQRWPEDQAPRLWREKVE